MRKVLTVSIAVVTLSAALSISGCGSSDPAKSPVGPVSATPAPGPAPSAGGATISGSVVSGPFAGLTVTVVDTPASSAVDPAGTFRLEHVPAGNRILQFTGLVTARLGIDGVTEREEIRLKVRVNGGTIEVEENERENDNRVELEGKIAELNVAGRTLRIGTTLVSVPIGIPIRHGNTMMDLSQLHVGDRIHVKATKSGATVTATEIMVQNQNQVPPAPGERVELEGTVQQIMNGTTCPSLTLMVAGQTVKTTASTDFHESPCSALTVGTKVEVKGTRQADGSILATRIEFEREDEKNEVELKGTISNKMSMCPSLTFTVASTVVMTNGSTQFKDTSCGGLANGDTVEVKGTRQSNGSVLASRVEKKK